MRDGSMIIATNGSSFLIHLKTSLTQFHRNFKLVALVKKMDRTPRKKVDQDPPQNKVHQNPPQNKVRQNPPQNKVHQNPLQEKDPLRKEEMNPLRKEEMNPLRKEENPLKKEKIP